MSAAERVRAAAQPAADKSNGAPYLDGTCPPQDADLGPVQLKVEQVREDDGGVHGDHAAQQAHDQPQHVVCLCASGTDTLNRSSANTEGTEGAARGLVQGG